MLLFLHFSLYRSILSIRRVDNGMILLLCKNMKNTFQINSTSYMIFSEFCAPPLDWICQPPPSQKTDLAFPTFLIKYHSSSMLPNNSNLSLFQQKLQRCMSLFKIHHSQFQCYANRACMEIPKTFDQNIYSGASFHIALRIWIDTDCRQCKPISKMVIP